MHITARMIQLTGFYQSGLHQIILVIEKCLNTEFFWSVFSCFRTEYGDLWSKSPYSARIQENKDQKKLHMWTLFTQCWSLKSGTESLNNVTSVKGFTECHYILETVENTTSHWVNPETLEDSNGFLPTKSKSQLNDDASSPPVVPRRETVPTQTSASTTATMTSVPTNERAIPIAVAFIETVNGLFKGADDKRLATIFFVDLIFFAVNTFHGNGCFLFSRK